MVTLINVVAMNALSKLQDFLELPEVDNPPDVCDSLDDSICMKIENGSFVWDGDLDHPHINDFNLTLKRGSIIAIVGDLGSGKSAFAAIMGQLKRTGGNVFTKGLLSFNVEPYLLMHLRNLG
jgi:ABC-type bacteriocin/lantibiotic exporter with double-glycine peptidase domain